MNDVKKPQEVKKPISDEALDKVSGGVIVEGPRTPVHRPEPKSPVGHRPEPC